MSSLIPLVIFVPLCLKILVITLRLDPLPFGVIIQRLNFELWNMQTTNFVN